MLKFQEKMRPNYKLDDKFRDQFLQSLEKDNQITIDIINVVKSMYLNKLQHYCVQFQVGFNYKKVDRIVYFVFFLSVNQKIFIHFLE